MRERSKESQVERFREAARELGCDDSEEAFNEALKRVARHRSKPDKPTDEKPESK